MLKQRTGTSGTRSAQPIVLGSGREVSKATLFNAFHYGGWLAFGAIWYAANFSVHGPLPEVLNDLSWIICGSVVSLCFRGVYRWARSAQLSYASLGLLALSLAIVGSPVWYAIDLALNRTCVLALVQFDGLRPIFEADAQSIALQPWLIPFRHWFLFGSTLFIWSSLYLGINAMLDLEIERARAVRATKLAESARLSVLQTQLNPHFLFNALNGISTLIREREATAAASMVDALGDFLRSMLQKLESPEIVVAEELAFIDQYLRIQRLRFDRRLRVQIDAHPETLGALMPTLILQPLVENAVRHGVLARENGGSVNVTIDKRADVLVVSVEDDGPGPMSANAQSFGVGLANSAERLAALYGDNAHMYIGPRTQGTGFAVILRLPFRQKLQTRTSSVLEEVAM